MVMSKETTGIMMKPPKHSHTKSQNFRVVSLKELFLLVLLTFHASALLPFLNSKDTASFGFVSSDLLHNSQLVNVY